MTWNGVAGWACVVNMLEYEPLASFQLHAETFDAYPAGMGDQPVFRDDTLTLGMGQRAVIEFTLPTVGRYMSIPINTGSRSEERWGGSPQSDI